MQNDIKKQVSAVTSELIEAAKLLPGDILVVGCSSSEVAGEKIGSSSSAKIADEIFGAIHPLLEKSGIYIACQCCEHLNRALVVEGQLADKSGLEVVSVIPQNKAGGAFATAAYNALKNPVVVEHIKADAGLDIGDTLIGMHLKHVAVPIRLSVRRIGQANVVCATTRPKLIGGERACYS